MEGGNGWRGRYRVDGYFVREGILAPSEVEALRARVREYTHGDRPRGAMRFQTEPRVSRGELAAAHPPDAVRKIEGLVEHDDLFRALALREEVVATAREFLGPDLKLYRNALLLKPPRVGSAKGLHQDSPYWTIEPMSLCSCWIALDDADEANGCMMVVPGAHAGGNPESPSVP